jgi:hypothetical protein
MEPVFLEDPLHLLTSLPGGQFDSDPGRLFEGL